MTVSVRESEVSPIDPAEAEKLRELLQQATGFATAFEPRSGLRAASEALQLARRVGDARSEAQALAVATLCHYHRGDYVSAVATGLDACATFSEINLAGRSHVLQSVALAFFSVGEYRRAEEAARSAIRCASFDGDAAQVGAASNILGYVLADSGHFDDALAAFRRARNIYRKRGDDIRVKKTASNAGHAWRKRGHALAATHDDEARRCWLRAMRYYRSALRIGRSRLDDAIILGSLGECALRLDRVHEALAHLQAAAQRTHSKDAPRIVAHVDLRRGETERALHRWLEAERYLLRALEASEPLENDELPVECRIALAQLADDRGDGEAARRWRDEARRIRDERREALAGFRREMRPLWDHFLRQE